ncbi:hypothetical protein ACEQ8H_007931 [Pleosporales sp. CAS-2024a]
MFADLARRGLTHPNMVAYVKRAVYISSADAATTAEPVEVPTWGVVLLYVSVWVAMVGVTMVSYMIGQVITTLCMVESPVTAITVSPSAHEIADKEEKETLLETGPTITLVNQKPITSSIRGTIKHLVAHAGRFARFRGYKIHVLHAILFSIVSTFLSAALPFVPGQGIVVAAVSGAVVANIHAAWTHKVVSLPTQKSFCQRLPSKASWKTLALPAAIEAAMPTVSLYLTAGVGMLMGLHKLQDKNMAELSSKQLACLAVRMLITLVFAVTCSLFLCLPAKVTLVRIEASLLPEDEETIVPFDRTFGGQLVSQMMGGSGTISFLGAWRSFNWEARRRLIKLFVKGFVIMTGMVLVMAHVLVAEAFVVMGPEMGKMMSQMSRAH